MSPPDAGTPHAAGLTLGAVQRHWAAQFAAAGIDTPALDARLLMQAATGLDAAQLILAEQDVLQADAAARFAASAERRLAREPVSKILGRREFWGRDFTVTADVLDPRPDSETLIAAVLPCLDDTPRQLLDLGTGSGCLLLTLLAERPQAHGLGTDISAAALQVAAANAQALGLVGRAKFAVSDWFGAVDGRFDVIIANPPYIAEAERADMAPEVLTHDPAGALFAAEDGLAAYRQIAAAAPAHLQAGGVLALEIGHRQAAAVTALVTAAGFAAVETLRDLAGRDRVVLARGGPREN